MFAFYWVFQRDGQFHIALKTENEVLHLTDVKSLKTALNAVKCLVTFGSSQELALIVSEGKSKYINQYLHIDLSQELGNKTIEEIGYFTGNDLRANDVKTFCEIRTSICERIFEEREEYIENKFEIIKEFKLKPNSISKTRANLSAEVLGAIKQPNRADVLFYELDSKIALNELPDELVNFYLEVVDQYKNTQDVKLKNQKKKITLCGLTHTFGFGGVHAAKNDYRDEGLFLHIDAKSFFTSIMINNDFTSKAIKDKSVVKKLHDKKVIDGDAAYKTIINAIVGSMNNPYSKLYDPNKYFSVTVSGQLIMAHLVLILENFIEELVQTNTDGIVVKVNPRFESLVNDLATLWAKHYQFDIAVTKIKKVIQKNVNNYIMITNDDKVWRTGIYSSPTWTSGSLKVVTQGLYECMVSDIKPQDYVVEQFKTSDIEEFYYISSKSKDSEYIAQKNGETYQKLSSTVCGIATTNKKQGGVYQIKKDLYSKLPGSPEHFTQATSATKSDVDVSWYINQIEKDIF